MDIYTQERKTTNSKKVGLEELKTDDTLIWRIKTDENIKSLKRDIKEVKKGVEKELNKTIQIITKKLEK